MSVTFEQALDVVEDSLGLQPLPIGWEGPAQWIVALEPDDTPVDDTVLLVSKDDGSIVREHWVVDMEGWPEVGGAQTLATYYDESQKRVPPKNPTGGEWMDTAGGVADDLGGGSDDIPGHEVPLVAWDSPEFRERAQAFSERTGGTFETPNEYAGFGPSYWLENAFALNSFGKNKATLVDELPDPDKVFYRGVGADRKEAETYIDQYKNGDHFPGKGIFGAGSYFATSREEAGEYAGWLREQDGSPFSDHTDLIRSAWKPGARLLTLDNRAPVGDPTHQSGVLNEIRTGTGGAAVIPGGTVLGGMNISRDLGAAAALAGYDGIVVKNVGMGDYNVVLNRGATYVTNENEVE